MVSTSSITKQSLGKILQRAPAVGAKMWCLFFAFLSRSESGALCVRGLHSSNKHCIAVYRPISTRSTRFSAFFFRRDCFFRLHFRRLGGATIFAKLHSKLANSPKIGGKVSAHHFV